ncbi:hypothetical protein T4C_506 [Trichinella pseudospiralis]|uniref:Uncharacterized protein n=1 Tax=Trichinella pseudospiralis TaxID=6337 RepID=A0A0V1JYE4_TRIPS|nr:hypothetical protein T4C_506 [Trichinella pseudospiralis]
MLQISHLCPFHHQMDVGHLLKIDPASTGATARRLSRFQKINVQCNTNNEIKSGINELCEMANMPGVGLEIFKAGGGWRDQKWAPPRSVKLPSLRQGRMQTLPCSLGR